MARSTTPLRSRTPPTRTPKPIARSPITRAPIARVQPGDGERAPRTKSRAQPRARTRDTGPTSVQRALVLDRDGGRCVRCGVDVTTGAVGFNDHHRQGRGMGGRQGAARATANSPANRLTLCGSGTTGCHGHVTEHPAEAQQLGLVVTRGGGIDPARVPVHTWRGWITVDHDGGWSPCPPPPDGDARTLACLEYSSPIARKAFGVSR